MLTETEEKTIFIEDLSAEIINNAFISIKVADNIIASDFDPNLNIDDYWFEFSYNGQQYDLNLFTDADDPNQEIKADVYLVIDNSTKTETWQEIPITKDTK